MMTAIECSVIVLQNALDKNGKTALDLCENVNQPNWQSAASLLRFAMSQPVSVLSASLLNSNNHCNTHNVTLMSEDTGELPLCLG